MRLKRRIEALEAASFSGHRNVIRLRCADSEQDRAIAEYQEEYGPVDERDLLIMRVFVDPRKVAA